LHFVALCWLNADFVGYITKAYAHRIGSPDATLQVTGGSDRFWSAERRRKDDAVSIVLARKKPDEGKIMLNAA